MKDDPSKEDNMVEKENVKPLPIDHNTFYITLKTKSGDNVLLLPWRLKPSDTFALARGMEIEPIEREVVVVEQDKFRKGAPGEETPVFRGPGTEEEERLPVYRGTL